jgi:DNA polymerase IV
VERRPRVRLGYRRGRPAVDRARGIDPRTVTPRRLPTSAGVRHRFPHDVLDGAAARSAFLRLIVQLGAELGRRGQAARVLALTLTFAGGPTCSSAARSPTAHLCAPSSPGPSSCRDGRGVLCGGCQLPPRHETPR